MTNKNLNIFDDNFFSEHNNSIKIKEENPQATVKEIEFIGANFLNISPDFIDSINKIFGKKSIFTYKSDGIFITNINNKNYLCACELKSNLRPDNFFKAIQQLEASIFKTLLLFNSILDIKNIETSCFIVAKINLNTQEKIQNIRYRNTNNKKTNYKNYHTFIQKKTIKITKNLCSLTKYDAIKNELLPIDGTLHFIA